MSLAPCRYSRLLRTILRSIVRPCGKRALCLPHERQGCNRLRLGTKTGFFWAVRAGEFGGVVFRSFDERIEEGRIETLPAG